MSVLSWSFHFRHPSSSVKNLAYHAGDCVSSLKWEDPWRRTVHLHFSWKSCCDSGEPQWLQSMESPRARHNLATVTTKIPSATLVHLGVLKHAKYIPISGLCITFKIKGDISILLVYIMHINMYVLMRKCLPEEKNIKMVTAIISRWTFIYIYVFVNDTWLFSTVENSIHCKD